jgi:LuxR family maltose regulon positive regulatory protein
MSDTQLIIRTKLDVPQTKGKILRRERLLNILKDNLDKRLILICADAGYGKTTLLIQFCQESKQPYVFYDLDAQDNDVATFFNYIIAGIRRHAADFGSRVKSVISEKRDNITIAGTFINEFVEKINGEFFIILDDYHRINENRKIADIINYLLRHIPRNLHIIISSRTTPAIYLSYYLAKQELLHLDKEHLQFDIRETQILMREIYGLDLQEDDIAQIAELSEGWVTVIQLILQKLSITPGKDIKKTLGNYTTSGEDVFDYFALEVFKYQTRAVRDFLIKTSVLEYLNAQICDHVLSIADSETIIDQLETDHIFVLRTGGNLIYHPLFHDFLYKKLVSSCPPQSIRRLHLTAAGYFYDRKEFASAVKHFLAAGQYARAAKILERHAEYWYSSGEHAGFVQLADQLPASFIEKYPYLLLKRAGMKYELMKGKQAARDVDKALNRLRRKRDYRGMAQAYNIKWLVCHGLMQSQKALYYIKRACEFAGKRRSSEKARIVINLGTAYRVLGRFKKAQAVLHEALQMARLLKSSKLEYRALHQLGMLYYNMSDLRRARDTFMEIATRFRDQVYPLELAYVYRTIASIAVDYGDIDNALNYITRTEQIVQEYCEYYLKCYLVLLRGRIEAYKADYPRAIELFKKAIALNRESDVKITDLYALLDMVDVYLKLGDVHSAHEALDDAAAVLSRCQDIPQHVVEYKIAKGRVETAEGDYDAAWVSFQRALRVNKKVFDPIQTLCIHHALSEYFLTLNNNSEALTHFKKC